MESVEILWYRGYWDEFCPIKTSDPEVKATAFVKTDSILISVGNFSESDRNVHLIIDWNSLGMDKTKALLKAPFVNDFQQASTFSLDEMIPIKRKEGLLLILSISK